MNATTPTNFDATTLEVHDVRARLAYLRSCAADDPDGLDEDERTELNTLDEFEGQCEGYDAWNDGPAILNVAHLGEWLQTLLTNTGELGDLPTYISENVDWEAAANEYTDQDYMEIDTNSGSYLIYAV